MEGAVSGGSVRAVGVFSGREIGTTRVLEERGVGGVGLWLRGLMRARLFLRE